MPGTIQRSFPAPYKYGTQLRAYGNLVTLHEDDTHTNDLCPDMWTLASSNGQIPITGNGTTAAETADFSCLSIYDQYRRQLPFQYVTGAQLDAARYYMEALPVGNITWIFWEDALGT